MNGNLLITTSVVLVIAGMVTMNLTSTVWAQNDHQTNSKNDHQTNSKSSYSISEMTNRNGEIHTNSNPDASSNCDSNSQCGKTMKNVMGMMGNLFNATIP